MPDATLFSSLVQAGSAGAVIVVVILFLKFLREERADFTERNNKVCNALDENTKTLIALSVKLVEHDEHVKPIIPMVHEVLSQVKPIIPILRDFDRRAAQEPTSKRRRSTDNQG